MRRFKLVRKEDVSGTSGTGIIAQGTEFDNGWVAMTWMTAHLSMTWFSSMHELKMIHSHQGKTKVVWVDPPDQNDVEEIEKEPDK